MKIGTKEFDKGLTKLWNSLGNTLIREMSTEDEDYVFNVSSRKSNHEPYAGLNAGIYGEPNDWVIEVDSDRQIPTSFEFNPDYDRPHYSISLPHRTPPKYFHPNLITNEMQQYLKYLGHDITAPGESIGMFFTNSEEGYTLHNPNLRDL